MLNKKARPDLDVSTFYIVYSMHIQIESKFHSFSGQSLLIVHSNEHGAYSGIEIIVIKKNNN